MYLLTLNFSGKMDDMEIQISLETPTSRFQAEVSCSERELSERAIFLSNLSEDFYNFDGSEIKIIFGPDLESSPCCKIIITPSNLGKFPLCLELHQMIAGRDCTKVDKCIVHFATDVAMLDNFVRDLKEIAGKTCVEARLEGYSLSDI